MLKAGFAKLPISLLTNTKDLIDLKSTAQIYIPNTDPTSLFDEEQ